MEQDTTFDSFHKLVMDCILVYDDVVVFLLDNFVPPDEVAKYVDTMAHLFKHSGHRKRAYFSKTRMAMFGHKFNKNSNTIGR